MAVRKDKNFTKENIENYVKLSFKILDVTNISVERETYVQYSNSDLVTFIHFTFMSLKNERTHLLLAMN